MRDKSRVKHVMVQIINLNSIEYEIGYEQVKRIY